MTRSTLMFSGTNAYEGVEVWCNDQYVGMSICPDYIFDLTGSVKEGRNDLRIEVATTLDRKVRGTLGGYFQFHRYPAMDPAGLVGPVRIWTKV
ncbi:MAG: hypothetical protein ACOYBG_08705 [Eubacteriales bacterium]